MTGSASAAARRRRALLVPLLTAVSAGLLVAHLGFSSDTYRNCRYLGPSTRMYVTSWAGLTCALGSLLVYTAVRRAAHRYGGPAGTTWRERLAAGSALLCLPLAVTLLMTVYWLYAPDPAGGDDCSGLARLVAP
ncbi:hypothetical protein J2Z21_004954 [Streptomyces griseochromogenes]|uniref:Uncharacterized protein n=1 Tax=Streptomyces griseochromogenes TaxID=68214 RepID=A0A1B1ASM9_9ACTN|nr:hypothetical protein [Streptomyces griseochromogenes]ANP49573.1 hypothetical protein AVL59_08125 [Streptomyces griseochromogenes]MBP2051977.1 hypothetical protein [Streptomyces griseochromogenes]